MKKQCEVQDVKNENKVKFDEFDIRSEMDSLEDAFAPTVGVWCKGCKHNSQWGIVCG